MDSVLFWHSLFYYLLGIVPAIFFSSRFFLQWLESEKKKTSIVSKRFWQLSICGNALCCLHYFVQLQFFLMLLQVINGFISWRNLNVLGKSKKRLAPCLWILGALIMAMSLSFFSQYFFFKLPISLFETPLGISSKETPLLWHIFGLSGCVLFASRFWIQWFEMEKTGMSHLGKHFWQISIIGSLAAMTYFIYMHDWISTLNYSFGLLPYIRNLILVGRSKKMLQP